MKRIIFENVFQDYEFLDRKEKLFNFLYSIGMDSNSDTSYSDINKDGENDTLMVHFNMGSVTVYVGLCNFSNGEFKYLLYVKSSDGIVLKPTFFDSVEEIEKNVSPYIETAYDDTKLSYLGIENEKEYVPSKSEYNDMLNSAIDSKDWEEASRIQNKYGKLYENMKRIIRLTERDLTRIVRRVMKEDNEKPSWLKRTFNPSAVRRDESIKELKKQADDNFKNTGECQYVVAGTWGMFVTSKKPNGTLKPENYRPSYYQDEDDDDMMYGSTSKVTNYIYTNCGSEDENYDDTITERYFLNKKRR